MGKPSEEFMAAYREAKEAYQAYTEGRDAEVERTLGTRNMAGWTERQARLIGSQRWADSVEAAGVIDDQKLAERKVALYGTAVMITQLAQIQEALERIEKKLDPPHISVGYS